LHTCTRGNLWMHSEFIFIENVSLFGSLLPCDAFSLAKSDPVELANFYLID
jgi:hypothetical protein